MKPRRPSLTARMAKLLDTLAFVCETTIALAPPEKVLGRANSTRESLEPSLRLYAEQARALVAEHQQRGTAS